jgi:hypothetical protein
MAAPDHDSAGQIPLHPLLALSLNWHYFQPSRLRLKFDSYILARPQRLGGDLDRTQIYRRFRLRVMLATAGLFALGLGASLTLSVDGGLWAAVKWAAVASPIVVAVAIFFLLPLGQMAHGLGLTAANRPLRLRRVTVFWMLFAIVLPWVAAWLVADQAGRWFILWRQPEDGILSGAYLWLVRLIAGAVTYSIASAVGFLVTFLFDSSLDGDIDNELT